MLLKLRMQWKVALDDDGAVHFEYFTDIVGCVFELFGLDCI